MALSQQTTTLSILRKILGPDHGQEKNFALLARKSVSWVKKTSAGITPLTEDSARVIQAETAISFAWLMEGNTEKPPTTSQGKPYTFADFETHRAALKEGNLKKLTLIFPVAYLPAIAAIGSAAGKKGMVSMFAWRLKNFLDKCRDEFGFDEQARNAVASEFKDMMEIVGVNDTWRNPITKTTSTFAISYPTDLDGCFTDKTQNEPPAKKKCRSTKK